MADRIRSFDWAATPLGPLADWPQSLKTVVDIMLGSPSMMSLVWGAEAIHLYNDQFVELLREHGVEALGRSVLETFARSRGAFADDLAAGMAGQSARLLAQAYPVLRDGRLQDAWFDVDYAPVRDEAGCVAGVLWTLREVTTQVTAQAALRESELRHRLLVGSWAQAVWEVDAHGVVVTDSPSWRAYTGQTLEEWLGYGWVDAIHPDDRGYAERQWREAVAAERLVNAEFRLRTADGGWRWTNVRAAPMRAADGAIVRWVGMNIDIDARRRAEEALLESERLQAAMLDVIPMGLAISDADGRIVLSNPQWKRFVPPPLPPSRDGVGAGRWWCGFRADRSTVEPADFPLARALRGETVDPAMEYLFRGDDGAELWTSVAAVPLITGDGRVTGAVSVIQDIDTAKRAQEALRASEARQQVLIEGVPQLVWRAVDGGRWTWASPQWTDFTGQSREDSRGHGWLDPVHPDDRPLVRAIWHGAIARGAFHADYRLHHAGEGRYRWVQARATPVRDAAGAIVEWLGTCTDVDDLRKLQDRQRILLTELQHRVRNILAVIRSIISRSDDGNRTAEEYVQHLQGRIAALARTQILLTRDAGAGVNLEEMIRDELLAQVAGDDQYSLAGPNVDLSPKAAEVLTLAIHELATNATKYGAFAWPGGRLAIEWTIEDRAGEAWLMLCWSERGVPIVDAVPRRQGFESELISRRIPYELKGSGRLAMRPGGLESRIEFPLRSGDSVLQTDGIDR